MINFAKFEIIGRIGEIDARPKVTLLSVCANYRRKGDDNEWQEDSHWNRVSSSGCVRQTSQRTRATATVAGVPDLAAVRFPSKTR